MLIIVHERYVTFTHQQELVVEEGSMKLSSMYASTVHTTFRPCGLYQMCGDGIHTQKFIAQTKDDVHVIGASRCVTLLCIQVPCQLWLCTPIDGLPYSKESLSKEIAKANRIIQSMQQLAK